MLRPVFVVAAMFASGCQSIGHPTNAPVTEQSTQVVAPDGVSISYDDTGTGPLTIVFIHGWNCDRSYWKTQRDFFSRNYRVVTIDLAGHGESGDSRRLWTMEAFGADVAAVAAALDLTKIVLVGHSMGGKVVAEAARQLSERTIAIVGADTFHRGGGPTATERLEAILANMQADYVGYVEGAVAQMFVEESDPTLEAFVTTDMASAPYDVARGARLASSRYDALSVLESLGLPVVLINSDYRPTPIAQLKSRIGEFSYRRMTGVGHFVMLEDPPAFNAHLMAVLEALEGQEAG